jgi:hypothetical protein
MGKGNTMQSRFIRTLLFAFVMLCMSAAAFARIGVVITVAPPPLPVYEQPICPGDGYLWTPGYWAWGDDFDDYYWVPGTWVLAPQVGFLWTPPYWGWGGDSFVFYDGYWGPQIGFYGGINYGFGYFGTGFEGGRWDGGHFFYNRAVMNVNVNVIHNVYNTTVRETTVNRVSYNGGNGGIDRRPTPEEEAASHERHVGPVAAQTQHSQEARSNQELRASRNQGKPPVAATAKPGEFKGDGVVTAREAGGPYKGPANTRDNNASSKPATHVRDLPPAERPPAPNTGNAKTDKKYQQQQDKQYAQQQKERQKMQQQQEKEDQKVAKQNNEPRKQQVEQQHQQQTQQLQQKHQQQNQQMQQRMAPAPRPSAPPSHPH